ncbi:THUMP domain-containing protein 1 [Trichomycterus rosablanca]|uniref:THUMP domain-containing protein 1 n=1 Tax=Trichomycterus rosablanca TaxID=2290929 RepID=UPI002F354021
MSEASAEGWKRSRKHYGGGRPKRPRGGRELEAGMQGILITCNMNERKCTGEAYSLLNEYADLLYGPEQPADPEGGGSEAEEEQDDAEEALKKEVEQIRASTEGRRRRFTALESGANNVVFIRTRGVEPDRLVHHVLQDLYTARRLKSRAVLRMLPVGGSCRAFPEDMTRYLETFLQPWFQAPRRATYQICFKSRNSSHSKRDDVIKSVAGLVSKLNPENKVDLTDPELSIIVEVIKSVCCVAVVRDYTRFRKYNLQEALKGPAEPEQRQREQKDPANQEQEQPEGKNGADQTEEPNEGGEQVKEAEQE